MDRALFLLPSVIRAAGGEAKALDLCRAVCPAGTRVYEQRPIGEVPRLLGVVGEPGAGQTR